MGRLKAVFGIFVVGDGFSGASCGKFLLANPAIVAFASYVNCLPRVAWKRISW